MKQLLTGKCLEDFENWFVLNNKHITLSNRFYNEFMEFPISMRFGVIQDFADSVGINITLHQLGFQSWYGYSIAEFPKPAYRGGVWRRDKAREETIKQFNKIYNEAK